MANGRGSTAGSLRGQGNPTGDPRHDELVIMLHKLCGSSYILAVVISRQ